MKNLVCTTTFIKEVREMRQVMEENLIDLMKRHGVNEVYCSDINACPPVIYNGLCEDDLIMLDNIRLVSDGDNDSILLEGIGEWQNGDVWASQIGIELLVEVYNWVMDYEDELFEEIKEKTDDED